MSHLSHQLTSPNGDGFPPDQCCSLPHLSETSINISRNTSNPLHQHHSPSKDTGAPQRHKQILLGCFLIVVSERQRKNPADGAGMVEHVNSSNNLRQEPRDSDTE